MLRIKTPATTSNLGVGFDCLGLALDLYNIIEFETSDDFIMTGFEAAYQKDNLVQKAYLDFCHAKQVKNIVKVSINLIQNDIPVARGLGSSASCIVSGVLAANYFNHLNLSMKEVANYVANYEGHPDNAFACIYGGLISCFKQDDDVYFDQFPISKKLHFGILLPELLGKTEALREILPKQINLTDAVFNLGRMIHLPKAFEVGDYELLKEVVKDTYHERYRSKLIPHYESLSHLAMKQDVILLVSGSGPTLFLISDRPNLNQMNPFADTFKLLNLSVSKGTNLEVIT